MPAPITSSFVHDVTESYLDKVIEDMGLGSTLYPEPDWLWVRYTGRTGGRPLMQTTDELIPAVWMEYLGGGMTGHEIAGENRRGIASEFWDVFAFMRFTPELMGLDSDDVDAFTAYADAAADILGRRLRLLLLTHHPSITCSILGHTTNLQQITRWAYTCKHQTELMLDYWVTLRLEQFVE